MTRRLAVLLLTLSAASYAAAAWTVWNGTR